MLNWIDECSSLNDLLRVYGTLCWNLSQITGRKDIPMIRLTYSRHGRGRYPSSWLISWSTRTRGPFSWRWQSRMWSTRRFISGVISISCSAWPLLVGLLITGQRSTQLPQPVHNIFCRTQMSADEHRFFTCSREKVKEKTR